MGAQCWLWPCCSLEGHGSWLPLCCSFGATATASSPLPKEDLMPPWSASAQAWMKQRLDLASSGRGSSEVSPCRFCEGQSRWDYCWFLWTQSKKKTKIQKKENKN